MPLAPGNKLGPYEIVSPLGAGGMGEVYRARDTRLGRDVAIKVLPQHLSSNPDLKARFEREAKAISALQHPHICTLHDIGSQDGTDFLAMELLEGESLAARPHKGPLPLKQALEYGIEIAEALEKAHKHGIVHRDLKPGNVMLTKSGAKLLDFGLAKGLVSRATAGAASVAPSFTAAPTVSGPNPASPLTSAGSIVGTIQYMAPEQVEGKDADARSDIFAMGAVLYEAVTCKRAFQGKSQISVASAILEKDPEPLSAIQPLTPPAFERVVNTCLAKNPDERFQSAHDLKLQLRWIVEEDKRVPKDGVASGWRTLVWIAVALLAGTTITLMAMNLRQPTARPARLMRFTIDTSSGQSLGGSWFQPPSVALSRDGSLLAYVATEEGISRIYLRNLAEASGHPISGTEGAHTPFFSPDGQWLAFYASGKLLKARTSGGPPVVISSLIKGLDTGVYGACWGADDVIYLGGSPPLGLLKVAATGGEPETLTALDATQHETEHRFPQLLPDGKNLLFVIRHAEEPSFDDADLAVLSVKTGKWKVLLKSGTDPHYLPTGDLVFLRAGVLLTVPFDLAKLKTKGEAVPVLEDVRENPRNGAGQFSISDDGTLVYVPGGISFGDHELVMVDKTGAARSLTATSRPYEDFTVSPDGRSIATTIEGPVTDTWIHDIARDTDTRFTFGVEHRDPTWTPDGKRLAYSGYADGHYGVFWKPVDGGQEGRLFASDNPVFAWFWAPSGRILVYAESPPATGDGIGIFSLDTHKATLLPHSSFDEEWASFSPDGK